MVLPKSEIRFHIFIFPHYSSQRDVDCDQHIPSEPDSIRPVNINLQLYSLLYFYERSVWKHPANEKLLIITSWKWKLLLLGRVWIYGATYCKINNFVSYMSVSASVFTLLAISNDRRKVILCFPLQWLVVWMGWKTKSIFIKKTLSAHFLIAPIGIVPAKVLIILHLTKTFLSPQYFHLILLPFCQL